MSEDEEEFHIVWGQDLEHCEDHCYELLGIERWRCLAPDHVVIEKCSEDYLHCKICFKIIENQDGINNYCAEHTNK